MRLDEITDEFYPNKYFHFLDAIPLWALTGNKPSNYHYGSSQLHEPIYKKISAGPGDELHWLHGGLFYVGDKGVLRVQLNEPGDFSPFEKNRSSGPAGTLKRFVNDDVLRVADKSQMTQTKYPT